MKAEIMQEIKSTENTSCQPTALLFREHTLLDPLMIHILESIGYQLIYFEEVELPEINNLQPNIIILDDCLTTTSIALNINVIKTQINAPIIYLTKAYALQPNQDQIMQICDDFILKPFNPEELKFRIQCTIMRYGKKTKQQTIKSYSFGDR